MVKNVLLWLSNLLFPIDYVSWRYLLEYGPYLLKEPNNTSEDFYKNIFNHAKRYISEESIILDAGCGLGRLTIDYANCEAKEVVGIDNNENLLIEAKAIAQNKRGDILQYRCHGNYKFLFANVMSIPFNNDYFSFISCVNVVDLVYDPQKMIQDFYRVLKTNGILLLATPYDWSTKLTPLENQVKNLKELINTKYWSIELEEDQISYNIQVNARRLTSYQVHLLILKKI